jgi:hypothetical protein
LERFIKGGCYVVVKASDWKAFAEMCDAAGITWGGRREKISEYEPLPLKEGRPIRVFVFGGGMRWASADAPKSIDMPVVGFRNLKPLTEIADRAVITSEGRKITARLIADKRTVKTSTATCSPEDTYRFGPGALLAMFRALETEEDRTLAMDLIGEERMRQLEAEIPIIREIFSAPRKASPEPNMDAIGDLIAKGLEEALKPLGAKVIVVGGNKL